MYVRSSVHSLPHGGPPLNCFQDSIWLRADSAGGNLLMGYVHHPLGTCWNEFLLITGAINYAPTLLGRSLAVVGFLAQDVCYSTFTNPSCLLPFIANIQQGCCIQHVADPARNRNIFDLIFTIGLMPARTSIGSRFFECTHLPVSCTFLPPFQRGIPSSIFRPCFRENWDFPQLLLCSCNRRSL